MKNGSASDRAAGSPSAARAFAGPSALRACKPTVDVAPVSCASDELVRQNKANAKVRPCFMVSSPGESKEHLTDCVQCQGKSSISEQVDDSLWLRHLGGSLVQTISDNRSGPSECSRQRSLPVSVSRMEYDENLRANRQERGKICEIVRVTPFLAPSFRSELEGFRSLQLPRIA